ncbi:NAD-glutamate dehydrogenase domain-containing protein [Rhodococcus sp. MSC1_016]|uniref:NAD-glutamate dehydrogenase domain-containing protein n=1 Tax=Rhodococcus sp. MSC1_016 TaxID=2909266 RepID=UPI00202DE3B2|nr:NAD-glutamate dehydrogenase domain-containing protein [Rhodococcus sp. MSC1_016]
MSTRVAPLDHMVTPLAADTDEAIAHLLLTDRVGDLIPRMIFLCDGSPELVEAVMLWPSGRPLLADVSNIFEHFGLRVADREDLPLPMHIPDSAALHKFTFQTPRVWQSESLGLVSEGFEAHALHGFEIDDYAKLIVAAGLSWREVVLVRAVCRFVRQAGLGLSESYIINTLLRHTAFADALVRYFVSRFDPDLPGRDVDGAFLAVKERLDAASTLDEDRILRSLEAFVTACIRTNWYQLDDHGKTKPYAAFKLDSSKLVQTGPVVPYREIYVYANAIEGIHARSGAVARGGLRFSDRPEDYRTEVLSLMKTQTVKNSPIVPVGAKGAFVRKSADITVAEAYAIFIRGLLDVTDNLVAGAAVPPARTLTYDGPDTYLVVAADKGTASFSDLANSIAVEVGYWLGDAFASGGSRGYDHKAMGITARGAWISVRRHFDELGLNVDTDTFTGVGIGDMSGDVFGNGMLLSRSIKIVAAFDHRHIFIDPDPCPERSYAERKRLFERAGSSWDDYDRDILSDGAGIWARSAKKISLSSQAQSALGIDRSLISPDDLIKAILTARVDLMWNGGIGTYVKASGESHADAADPVNDSVRVDANRLRCSVVGEGGNLGLTQRARIEYATAGGRINADFIDNAAGVATSDLEVNLKIALDVAEQRGSIDQQRRNRMLAEATADVANAVLRNSESQVLAISLAASQAPLLLNRHERLIDNLEQHSGIKRATEFLPTEKELVTRTRAGLGLTRPEIAVLLAQSKNIVRDELLDSRIPEDAAFAGVLSAYFPQPIRDQLPAETTEHYLRREIIATKVADDLINHVGPGLIYQLEERLGVKTPAVAAAYAVVRGIFNIDDLWDDGRRRANAGISERWEVLHTVQHFIERTASWILRRRPASVNILAEIDRYRPGVNALLRGRPTPSTSADTADHLRFLGEAFELIETAQNRGCPVEMAAEIHRRTDAILGITWLSGHLENHMMTNWWDSMAAVTVRDDLSARHHALVGAILDLDCSPDDDPVHMWQERSETEISRFTRMTSKLRRDGVVDVSRACTASAELGLLVRNTRA